MLVIIIKNNLSLFSKLVLFLITMLFFSCKDEVELKTSPEGIQLKTASLSGDEKRLGAGDFENDVVFKVVGFDVDSSGKWKYTIELAGYKKSDSVFIENGQGNIKNFLTSEEWQSLETDENSMVYVSVILENDQYEKDIVCDLYFIKDLYGIGSWQDLKAIENDLSGHYTLRTDIVFPTKGELHDTVEEKLFNPIGFSSDAPKPFSGSLNGNGHTIKGFFVNNPLGEEIGLFSILSDGAVVENVHFIVPNNDIVGMKNVGAIAGYIDGATVKNCTIDLMSGDIDGKLNVGGVVGYINKGSVENCTVTGENNSVKGHIYIGGIAGYVEQGEVKGATFVGTRKAVSGNNHIGGIAGYVEQGRVNECTVIGSGEFVIGEYYVGGFVGSLNEGEVDDCTLKEENENETDSVSGIKYVGGAVGRVQGESTILNCDVSVQVQGEAFVGGFTGSLEGDSNMELCRSEGAVNGKMHIGGICGLIDENAYITRCFSYVEEVKPISETDTCENIGGLVGYLKGYVEECKAVGVTVGGDESFYVGGLIGKVFSKSIVKKCLVIEGYVSGADNIGGLVGKLDPGGEIHHSCSKIDVSGKNQVGGLVGSCSGRVTNCYARNGIVTGKKAVGGLLGRHIGIVNNCYASMDVVSTATNHGLFVGDFGEADEGTMTGCYFEERGKINGSSDDSKYGLYKRTKEQFTTASLIDETVREIFHAWLFNKYWYTDSTHNDGYPFLYIEEDLNNNFD